MNERDSEFVTGLLLDRGFEKAGSIKEADVVIFNTCSVRKHAEDRAISNMGKLLKRKPQTANRKPQIYGIIGCTAQALKERLFQMLPELDIVCGPGEIHNLPRLIDEAGRSKVLACDGIDKEIPKIKSYYRENKTSAYVMISRGCNNFCTYCIVPYVRGPERSRKPEDIINEVKDLLDRGCVDITLLGQNVNSYGKDLDDGVDFVKLLHMIDGIGKEKNIKFLTSHPKDVSAELFEAIKDLKGLSKHLHLPLQSGSDRILKAMNRGYDSEYYLDRVRLFRSIVREGAITTDIIVGFPGESDEDYKATKDLLNAVEFNAGYIFKYSSRPPALSSKMTEDIPKDVKERRHRELLEMQKAISKKKMKVRQKGA